MEIKEKNEKQRHWCKCFLSVSTLFLIAASVLAAIHEAGSSQNAIAYAFVFGAVLSFVAACAVWENVSETGIAGELAIFLFWIFSRSNWGKPEFVDILLKGGAAFFLLVTFVGFLVRPKDEYRAVNVICAVMVTAIIFFVESFTE